VREEIKRQDALAAEEKSPDRDPSEIEKELAAQVESVNAKQ